MNERMIRSIEYILRRYGYKTVKWDYNKIENKNYNKTTLTFDLTEKNSK